MSKSHPRTIQLELDTITAKIMAGDNYSGAYYLAARARDRFARIFWAETQRAWNPWPDDCAVIALPALDPEGSGRASDDAQDMLRATSSPAEFAAAAAQVEAGERGWVELAEELHPEDWRYNREETARWLAEEFLRACNGEETDLPDDPPQWSGHDKEGYGPPPARLAWAAPSPRPPTHTYHLSWTVFATAHTKTVDWPTFRHQAQGQRLSCYVVDEDNTTIATNTMSARPLNEWLTEINAAFGRHNVTRLDLDPAAVTLTITLRGWRPTWGYYPNNPPWYAAHLAALQGAASFASWRDSPKGS